MSPRVAIPIAVLLLLASVLLRGRRDPSTTRIRLLLSFVALVLLLWTLWTTAHQPG